MSLEFETPAHEELYHVVEDYLVALDVTYTRNEDDAFFTVRIAEDVRTHILVVAWGDDDALLLVRSWIVRPAQLTSELMRYLLGRNTGARLGALAIDDDDDIMFQYTLGAAALDRTELRDAINAVSFGGARARDRILSRFDGRPL
jgi:hypothetical protein